MKKSIIGILLSILFYACGSQPQNSSKAILMSDAHVIDIAKHAPHLIRADEATVISTDEMLDMLDSIDYIKLDSSEPIGQIDKMIVTGGKMYIMDSHVAQQIFVFDMTGKLLYRIKNKGRGPQEYISIWDMQIDTVKNEILLNDPISHSYIYYSNMDGKFIRRKKGVANCYLAVIDSLYVNYQIPGQDFNDEENWSILVSDKDSVIFKGFEPKPLQESNYIVNSFCRDVDGALLFTPINSDTVYQFSSACSAFPKYVICQAKSIWKRYNESLSEQEICKLIKENSYTRYEAKFLATAKYCFFSIEHRRNQHIISQPHFWDKRTDKVYRLDAEINPHAFSEIRDILSSPRAVYNNCFFGLRSPMGLLENAGDALNPKLRALLENTSDGDNPLVIMYRLK